MKLKLIFLALFTSFVAYTQNSRFLSQLNTTSHSYKDSIMLVLPKGLNYSLSVLNSKNEEISYDILSEDFVTRISDTLVSVSISKLFVCSEPEISLRLLNSENSVTDSLHVSFIEGPIFMKLRNIQYLNASDSYSNDLEILSSVSNSIAFPSLGVSFEIDTKISDSTDLNVMTNTISGTNLQPKVSISNKKLICYSQANSDNYVVDNLKINFEIINTYAGCNVKIDTTFDLNQHFEVSGISISSINLVPPVNPTEHYSRWKSIPYLEVQLNDESVIKNDVSHYVVEFTTDSTLLVPNHAFNTVVNIESFGGLNEQGDSVKFLYPSGVKVVKGLGWDNLYPLQDPVMGSSLFPSFYRVIIPKDSMSFIMNEFLMSCKEYYMKVSAVTPNGIYYSSNSVKKFNSYSYAKLVKYNNISLFETSGDTLLIYNSKGIDNSVQVYPPYYEYHMKPSLSIFGKDKSKVVKNDISDGYPAIYNFTKDDLASSNLYQLKIQPDNYLTSCSSWSDSMYIKPINFGIYYNTEVNGQKAYFDLSLINKDDFGVFVLSDNDGNILLTDTIIGDRQLVYTFKDTGNYKIYIEYQSLKYKTKGLVQKGNILETNTLEAYFNYQNIFFDEIKITEKFSDCGISFSSKENLDGTFTFEAITSESDTVGNIKWLFPDGASLGNVVTKELFYGWNTVTISYVNSETCKQSYTSMVYRANKLPCTNKIVVSNISNKYTFEAITVKDSAFGSYIWYSGTQKELLGTGKVLNYVFPAETQKLWIYCEFQEFGGVCESVDSIQISVNDASYSSYNLLGKVNYEIANNQPIKFNVVLQNANILDVNSESQNVYKTKTDEQGNFEFKNLFPESTYYLLVSADSPDFSNTYYESTLSFDKAKTIFMNQDQFINIKAISLVQNSDSLNTTWDSGDASIEGVVSYTSVLNNVRVAQNSLSQPLIGAIVELYDSKGNLLTRTISGLDGTYKFSNLKEGTYEVKTMAIGSSNVISKTVVTNESKNPFIVSNIEFAPRIVTNINVNEKFKDNLSTWSSFPNPVNTQLTIVGFDGLNTYTTSLFDSQGRLVKSWDVSETSTQLLTDELPVGIYFVRILNGYQNKVLSFVKE